MTKGLYLLFKQSGGKPRRFPILTSNYEQIGLIPYLVQFKLVPRK